MRMKTPKQKLKAKCDKLWAEAIQKRDGCCQYPDCGKTERLASHHIFSRRGNKTRHDLDNGVSLCWYHHRFKAHSGDITDQMEYSEWIKGRLGRHFDIMHKLSKEPCKPDYNLEIIKLTEFLKGV